MNYMTLRPGYGRQYKSIKEVKADWDADKDFVIASYGPDEGRYINKAQALGIPNTTFSVRYAKDTKITSVLKND